MKHFYFKRRQKLRTKHSLSQSDCFITLVTICREGAAKRDNMKYNTKAPHVELKKLKELKVLTYY